MRTRENGIYAKALEEARRRTIITNLKRSGGDVYKTAEQLGISVITVRLRAHKEGFPLEDLRHYNTGRR